MKDEIETLDFKQIIEGMTRTWPGKEDSLLDQCWTNRPDRILSWKNSVRSTGDHNVIEIIIRIKGKDMSNQEIRTRCWKKFDLNRYQDRAASIDWDECLEITELNLADSWLTEKINSLLDMEAPWRTVLPRRQYRSWITLATKDMMEDCDRTREVARVTQSNIIWEQYRQLRGQCNKAVKTDRVNHFKEKYEMFENNNDSKGTYNLIKTQAGWKNPGAPTQYIVEGKVVTSPQKMAEAQMKFFDDKIRKMQEQLPVSLIDPLHYLNDAVEKWGGINNVDEFNIREATQMEVLQAMKELGNSSSSGMDGVDSISLKAIAPQIFRAMTHIVNLSVNGSTFANKWKLATVVPIHKGKKLPRNLTSSYRPISMLTVTSKIVERIIQKQLLEHLLKNKLLNMNQHSYRPCHSTTTAISQLMDSLYEATDHNLVSVLLSVDQSAAFDNVCHDILIRKLEKYKCSRNTLRWFENYLRFRSQTVIIGSKKSTIKPVKSGVPQGSILGPLLFCIYTNEMPNILRSANNCQHENLNNGNLFGSNCAICGTIICYADDATMTISNKHRTDNQEMLKSGLDTIENFLTANKLAIKRSKTTIAEIMIGQKRAKLKGSPPVLQERETDGSLKTIKVKKSYTLLGAKIQDNMTWGEHTESGEEALLPMTRRKLGVLRHLGGAIPQKSKKLLSEGIILSRLRYLIPQWSNTTEKILRNAQTILNDTARFIANKPDRRSKTLDLMKEQGWLTITEMAHHSSLQLLWKILRQKSPENLSEKITLDQDHYALTDYPRLQHTQKGFRWKTCQIWNEMPRELRENEYFPKFKKESKKWLIRQRDPG